MNRTFLKWLIAICLIEGLSTLVLFFHAMPMKYIFGRPEWVSVVGPIHGFLFVVLVLMFVVGRRVVPLGDRLFFAGLVGAVLPFVPFIVDVWLVRLLREDSSGRS
ncbi:MAG: DUF3817 domain-containing protein [Phycisphaerales bacterium]|jgi:integral membrane protein|nr:DUF3817 domain-containing protein [Phycisphaerales bacterium]